MKGEEHAALVQSVQTNCDIADARHAHELTLCTYLMQMREFYRWAEGLPFQATLARDALGAWLAEREARWSALEAQPLVVLPGPGAMRFDAFDVPSVNRWLRPKGLVYGAGLVGRGQPVFFLAELHGVAEREGLPVVSAGRELARGLMAPPAALGWCGDQRGVLLRREALARWCWQQHESHAQRRAPGSAFDAVVKAYGLDAGFDAALPRWLDEQTEALVLHELGEHRAGERLGPGWAEMRLALPDRRSELLARAVRDHLADLAVTLPALLAGSFHGPLHFWFATYDGQRQALFPGLVAAYAAWRAGDGGQALLAACACGEAHFAALAAQVLAAFAEGGADAAARTLAAPGAVFDA